MPIPNKDEKKKNIRALNERYIKRITVARQGQEAYASGDFMNAVKHYNQYLKILADVKDCDSNELGPQHFDVDKELSELLLISHIYWDLCRVFDMTPHLEREFQKCLYKFTEFTYGFRYQVVNAEMLRKFIKKDRMKHKEEFKEAYKRIFIASKKCFVATLVFGEHHPVTESLREFKDKVIEYSLGQEFVLWYYKNSPIWVDTLQRHPKSLFLAKMFLRPILFLISKIVHKVI